MKYKTLSPPEKWFLKGIPIIFLLGSLLHFLYDFSGENIIAAIISPVNESVWEHLKMLLLPMIGWWVLYYIVNGSKFNINKDKWFASTVIALLVSIISIPLMYYFYTEALGVELVVVDILILLIAIIFGQLVAFNYYKHSEGIDYRVAILVLFGIVLIFTMFTFNPPHLPIFQDTSTGKYGIEKGA